MRNLCVGDIHGSYTKLMKSLENCGFDDTDNLYFTGDMCDRGFENLDTLRFLKGLGDRFKPVFGNHDIWLYRHMSKTLTWSEAKCWYWNGGNTTDIEVSKISEEETAEFKGWMDSIPYVRMCNGKRIMHTPTYSYVWERCTKPIEEVTLSDCFESFLVNDTTYDEWVWDRSIVYSSEYFKDENGMCEKPYGFEFRFSESDPLTIIGHTPLKGDILYDKKLNIVGIDTGGFCDKRRYGFDGRITVLDIDTLEWWDSDSNHGNLE